jgi:hypothetical protein
VCGIVSSGTISTIDISLKGMPCNDRIASGFIHAVTYTDVTIHLVLVRGPGESTTDLPGRCQCEVAQSNLNGLKEEIFEWMSLELGHSNWRLDRNARKVHSWVKDSWFKTQVKRPYCTQTVE